MINLSATSLHKLSAQQYYKQYIQQYYQLITQQKYDLITQQYCTCRFLGRSEHKHRQLMNRELLSGVLTSRDVFRSARPCIEPENYG